MLIYTYAHIYMPYSYAAIKLVDYVNGKQSVTECQVIGLGHTRYEEYSRLFPVELVAPSYRESLQSSIVELRPRTGR